MEILKETIQEFENREFVDIYKIIKSYGIHLIEGDLDLSEILGTRVCYKNKEIIFVKKNISLKEKRFILAHEFCHFLLNEKGFNIGILKAKDFVEKRADNFATDLLLPNKALIEAYKNFENIPTLSDIFGVPEKIVEYKLNKIFIKYF